MEPSHTEVSRLDDVAFIERLRTGDVAAFEHVFHAQYDGLCRFATRYLRDEASAEDVVQDVFRTLWLHRATIPSVASLRSYLYAAVRNRVLSVRRHDAVIAHAAPTIITDLPALGVAPSAPDDETHARELARAVERVASTLPERRRECFLLTWRDGLTCAEVANVLGLSYKTVNMHLGLAYRDLRDKLAPYL